MKIFIKLFTFINLRKKLILIIILALAVTLTSYLKYIGFLNFETIILELQSHPVLAPSIFVLGYSLMVVFLIPTLPMNLGAGLIWGTVWGGILTVISTAMGATAAFYLSRYIAHDYFEHRFKGRKTWDWLQNEMQQQNWKIVALTRSNPAFPFGLSSYFFGLTKLSFKNYFWPTVGFVIPPAFIFAGLGDAIGGIALNGQTSSILNWVFLTGLFVAALMVMYFVAQWRKYLKSTDPNFKNIDTIKSA